MSLQWGHQWHSSLWVSIQRVFAINHYIHQKTLNLTAHVWKKYERGFPKFDNSPQNLHEISSKLVSWKKIF